MGTVLFDTSVSMGTVLFDTSGGLLRGGRRLDAPNRRAAGVVGPYGARSVFSQTALCRPHGTCESVCLSANVACGDRTAASRPYGSDGDLRSSPLIRRFAPPSPEGEGVSMGTVLFDTSGGLQRGGRRLDAPNRRAAGVVGPYGARSVFSQTALCRPHGTCESVCLPANSPRSSMFFIVMKPCNGGVTAA